MNPLETELHRLYLVDDATADTPCLLSADGRVRAMVMELSSPADWAVVSTVWQRVQGDMELPAPAIAVSGNDGYQLWFSLVEPVTTSRAIAFLEALRRRYLSTIATNRISLMPTQTQHAQLVPALQSKTGQWSAFVAPDLAAIFSDSPGLDVCPSPDAQAKVLTRLDSLKLEAFQAVLDQLVPSTEVSKESTEPRSAVTQLSVKLSNTDAKLFLREVMNDKSIEMHLRIDAAKALLPYS